jgi:hypothetical protein
MIVPISGHGKEHERHGKVHLDVLRALSVAESLGSPPSLERHYKMRFSIDVFIFASIRFLGSVPSTPGLLL